MAGPGAVGAGCAERLVHRSRRRRLRAVRLLRRRRSRPRTSTGSPPNGLRYTNMHTTALCSPTRSCILTGRNHHSNGMACITEGVDRLSRATTARMPFENGILSEMLLAARLQHVLRRQVAPDAGRGETAPPGRTTAGRSAAASSASTASSAARPTSGYPDLRLRQPPGRAADEPEEGYHLSEDLADQAIEFIAGRARRSRRTSRSSCYYCTGAAHAPHHVPKEWADRYKGQFDAGWDDYREKVFARQKELGHHRPRTRSSRAHDPDVPAVGRRCSDDEQRLYARMMEVFAGFLEPHRSPLRPAPRLPRADRRARQHARSWSISDNGASAEGGPTGSVEREPVLQQRARTTFEENLDAHRRARRPEVLQPLPVGLGLGRQHAVPALEARDLPRRRRPTRSSSHWPDGHRGQGRDAHAVRARRSTWCPTVLDALGIEPPADDPRRHPVADRGRQLRRTPSTTPRRRRKHHTQYFEMFGHRSIYHDGWRAVCPWPGTDVRRGGRRLRQLELDRGPAARARRDRLGALPRRRRLRRDRRPRRAGTRQAHRDDRALVGRGRQVQRPPARQPRHAALRRRSVRRSPAQRDPYVYYPGTQAVPENVAATVLNRPHSITADVESRRPAPKACSLSHGSHVGGYVALRPRRQAALRPQLRRRQAVARGDRDHGACR